MYCCVLQVVLTRSTGLTAVVCVFLFTVSVVFASFALLLRATSPAGKLICSWRQPQRQASALLLSWASQLQHPATRRSYLLRQTTDILCWERSADCRGYLMQPRVPQEGEGGWWRCHRCRRQLLCGAIWRRCIASCQNRCQAAYWRCVNVHGHVWMGDHG